MAETVSAEAVGRTHGLLVVLEGPEGSGKTTQIAQLRRHLERAGVLALETREPGGTVIGQELRGMLLLPDRPPVPPLVEAFLMCADRAQHVEEVIRPALASGMVVLSDRFSDSTLAHQGYGLGLDLHVLRTLTGIACAGLVPDLTVVLDIDVSSGLRRKQVAFAVEAGELNRIDRRDLAYHERVRRGFLDLAAEAPKRYLVVNGAQPAGVITAMLWHRLARLLCLPGSDDEPL